MRSWSAMLLVLSEHKPLDSLHARTYQTRAMQCTGTPREPEAPRLLLLLLGEAQRSTAQRSVSRAELSRGVVVGVSGHTLLAVSQSLAPSRALYTPLCACRNVMPVESSLPRNTPLPPAQSQHVRRRGRPGHCREFLALALDSSPQHQQQHTPFSHVITSHMSP